MSEAPLSHGEETSLDAATSDVPDEYSDAYQRAYQRSLSEYPTELMSPARPGKRAAEPPKGAQRRATVEKAVADLLINPRRRTIAGVVGAVLLLVLAYAAGRMLA